MICTVFIYLFFGHEKSITDTPETIWIHTLFGVVRTVVTAFLSKALGKAGVFKLRSDGNVSAVVSFILLGKIFLDLVANIRTKRKVILLVRSKKFKTNGIFPLRHISAEPVKSVNSNSIEPSSILSAKMSFMLYPGAWSEFDLWRRKRAKGFQF